MFYCYVITLVGVSAGMLISYVIAVTKNKREAFVAHKGKTEEEKEFLREQKKQLVEEYEKNLRRYNR